MSEENENEPVLTSKQLEEFEEYYFSVNHFTCPHSEAKENHHYIESYWLWAACVGFKRRHPTCETCKHGKFYKHHHPCSMDKDCIECQEMGSKPIFSKDFYCKYWSEKDE